MEPEAEVKLVQNFYYKMYWVCNWEAGKEVLQPVPVYSLRLRLRYVKNWMTTDSGRG